MGKKYRWNWKKFLNNMAEPVAMAALVAMTVWVMYLWMMEG